LNPPLHFSDEPCRHKILDLIGDLSLFAQFGNQGLPVAHIVAYKVCAFRSQVLMLFLVQPETSLILNAIDSYACYCLMQGGHALHVDLARQLMGIT
jgi:UDP-3-O-acyl-N-acetylglucosamine deacetylase